MSMNVIIGIAACVVVFIVVYIKMTIDEKKGENSIEKQKINAIVKNIVPDGETCTVCYGTREDFSIGGGGRMITTTTEYSYYGIGFRPGELYLVPLAFEGDEISYFEPKCFSKENLRKVEVKNGRIILQDADENTLTLFVTASNTKDDKYHPVNIQQQEETEAFFEFAHKLMDEINT